MPPLHSSPITWNCLPLELYFVKLLLLATLDTIDIDTAGHKLSDKKITRWKARRSFLPNRRKDALQATFRGPKACGHGEKEGFSQAFLATFTVRRD